MISKLNYPLQLWKRYTDIIDRNCGATGLAKDIDYWRNNLFSGSIIFLLPFCLIAIVPGIYFCLLTGLYTLAAIDIITISAMLVVAFLPGLKVTHRKILFFSFTIIVSCALLLYGGLSGPGLLYLLAACILCILILPGKYAFKGAWIITVICILFTLALYFNVFKLPRTALPPAAEWIAVSSNLVFIVFLLAALIPRLFAGLQETLNKEKELKEALSKQRDEVQRALHLVEQKNKELEQFAYMASHDLQEPLRMVTSFMELLKNKYGDQLDSKAHTYIAFAVDGGMRMQKMISGLLELSRTGRSGEIKSPADAGQIINEVKRNIFKLIEEEKVSVIIDSELPVLPVYYEDICRLFQNLFTNAIKYKHEDVDPVIHISCMDEGNMWHFNISDNGIGIDDNQYEKIFEVFSRLHAQKTYEGSGIGLAICKKIAEQHGGTIGVVSEKDKGSTFYFTIPKE